ncbi:MAG: hypothetical protein HY769_04595 [Candidatus Stahlbacteria bacterium]|nr:hypothetical protein [Candidatus Stahlbacteria bacterium]
MCAALLLIISINVSKVDEWDTPYNTKKHLTYWELRRDPYFAAMLSLCLPGAGQFYNRDWLKGGLIVGANIGCFGLMYYTTETRGNCEVTHSYHPYSDFAFLCLLGQWIFSICDAHFSAVNKNLENRGNYGVGDVGLLDNKIIEIWLF